MITAMEHESFYASGTYFAPQMGTYAGWVAIENSFAAGQVFFNEENDVALILSGECFVDLETPAGLKQKGHRLGKNEGDWLVHLYEEEGDKFFERLNGIFSGLLIDKRQAKVFLFNDRYGVERIYCHEADGEFYFASEAKALLCILPELRAFDEQGVAQFLTFGCTLEGRTLFRGIHLLPAGSLWSFENGKCRQAKYFSPEIWENQLSLSIDSFQAKFQATFKRILPRYFESRSKIGISLTAGLDGRMIMACRPDTDDLPVCYTFCGPKQETLDAQLAARVAEACGLEHQILRIGPDFFSDFASHVDRTVYVTDGCLGALGAHEIYMNRQARRLAPVRVTGVFGGEILRGVSMFKPIRLSPRLVNPGFGHSLTPPREWRRNGQHPVTFRAFREIPERRFGTPAASRSQLSFRTPYLDNEIVALAYQVPEILRTSPLPALRVVRDNNPRLSKIATDMGEMAASSRLVSTSRRIFARAARKLEYIHNEGLPPWLSAFDRLLPGGTNVFGRHKFLHYRTWFQRELRPYVDEVLRDSRTHCSPIWDGQFLDHMALEHSRGRKNYMREIDAVLTLEAVERLLFRDLPRKPNC